LPKSEVKNYKNEVLISLFFFPMLVEWQFTNKIYYESRSHSKVFQNASIPWLPTRARNLAIFCFFGNLENLGYLKKKKSFVDGYAPLPPLPPKLSKPPTFFLSLSGEFSHCGDKTI
jgi:hypothetical protein